MSEEGEDVGFLDGRVSAVYDFPVGLVDVEMREEYTCGHCGGVFERDSEEVQRLEEAKEYWPGVKVEEMVEVCGECWDRELSPELPGNRSWYELTRDRGEMRGTALRVVGRVRRRWM